MESTLKRHVEAKHKGSARVKKYECGMCPAKFFIQRSLVIHINQHVKEKCLECTQCTFKTHGRNSLDRHVREQHRNSVKYSCSHSGCNFRSARSESLERHLRTHNPDPTIRNPFPCSFLNCSYRGRSTDALNRHVYVHHNPNRSRNIPCPLCPQMFFDKDGMRSHVKNIHTKEKHLKCSKCDFVTRLSNGLENHFKRKHGDGYVQPRNAKCELCFYLGLCKNDVKLHEIKFHEVDLTRQFPFTCSVPSCDFRSRTEGKILKHQRLHQSPKKLLLRCELCPENIYPNWDSIRFHQWIAHGRKCHRCSMCNYVARKKSTWLSMSNFIIIRATKILKLTGSPQTYGHKWETKALHAKRTKNLQRGNFLTQLTNIACCPSRFCEMTTPP